MFEGYCSVKELQRNSRKVLQLFVSANYRVKNLMKICLAIFDILIFVVSVLLGHSILMSIVL